MTQETLKLALEALEEAWYHVGTFQPTEKAIDLYDEARAAIKEALAQTQEPVAWMDADGNVSDNNDHKCFPIPLYTTPPQRTWVGLTDDEMTHAKHHMVEGAYQYSFKQGALWAEAKLKELNT